MSDPVARIAALGDLERRTLVRGILDGPEEIRDGFLDLLRDLDDTSALRLYTSLPAEWANHLREEAAKHEPLSPERRSAVELEVSRRIDDVVARLGSMERYTVLAQRRTRRQREGLKSAFAKLDRVISDQTRGLPRWPPQKPPPADARIVVLPAPDRSVAIKPHIFDCIADRVSRRRFLDTPLDLSELSYLLWATQGLRKPGVGNRRTVPSGGAMHPLETYLAAHRVNGLDRGIYRYLPLQHALVSVAHGWGLSGRVTRAAMGQGFVGHCAVTFLWSAVPYRTEWRYTLESRKLILLDAGHACQNLYLACESIGCGTCAIGAYDQRRVDKLCGLDGRDEMIVYMAPVGKI